MAQYITLAARILDVFGTGQYDRVRLMNQDAKVVVVFRWNLTDEQIDKLKRQFYFIKLRVQGNNMYISRYVKIPDLALRIVEEKYRSACSGK